MCGALQRRRAGSLAGVADGQIAGKDGDGDTAVIAPMMIDAMACP